MKKLAVLTLLLLIIISGCTNKVEEEKNAYLSYKSDLEEKEEFTDNDKLDFNIYFDINRVSDEMLAYSLIINDINVDMYKVKALLIHDFFTDDVFPSVGIFEEPLTLHKNTADKVELKGVINTDKDNLDIKFKLYLEYEDENQNKNTIYYEVPRG